MLRAGLAAPFRLGQSLDLLDYNTLQDAQRFEVSHWIYFTSEALRGKFCEAMRELRYEILPFLPSLKVERQASHTYGVQIGRSDRVDQESIDAAVLEIFRFARAADGEYDGWETEAVRPPSPFKSFLRRAGLSWD